MVWAIWFFLDRLKSGIRNRPNFFVWVISLFRKIGTDSMNRADSRDIKNSNSLEFRFWFFRRIFENAWVVVICVGVSISKSYYKLLLLWHFNTESLGYLLDFALTHAILTPVKSIFWAVFRSQLFSAVSHTHKISIKIFLIWQRIYSEYSRNFPILATYGFGYAKVKKTIFNSKILELVPNIGIILNDF